MNVRREKTPEIAEKLKETFQKKIDEKEPPDKIWLTDTVYCGRKKIYAMMGWRQRFTEQTLSKLWLGIIVHQALKDMGIAGEVPVEYMNIKGKMDVLLETGEPLEIKVTSSTYVPASEYAETHIEQLSRYCLALKKQHGIILYYIPGINISSLPAYRCEFNLSEVANVTAERINLLEKAAEARDPFILPTTWHSNNMDNWECRKCTFQAACRAGGYIV